MLIAAADGASVRELERMATESKKNKAKSASSAKSASKSTFYSEVELSLKNEIGRKVYIKPTSKGKGTLTIEFYSDEELADFARKLSD